MRLPIYKEHIEKLLKSGDAYYCFCTRERLTKMREDQMATKQQPKYDRKCCNLSKTDVQSRLDSKESHVVRMKMPDGETVFEDEIRGSIKIQNSEVDDQVILKSDGFPTYHLAVVVDDHLMQITHVIRGEEWISSTPKHVALYEMFGWDLPKFAHVPLLLNPDKSKLSKRQGDVSVEDYLKRGYLPEALINFVSLLGFNPRGDRELYSIEDLIEFFELSKVNKSGAILNMDKLDWMNNHYLRQLSENDLKEAARPFVQANVDDGRVLRALMIERERTNRLDELQEKIEPYLETPAYAPEMLVWKKADATDAKASLEGVLQVVSGASDSDFEKLEGVELIIKDHIEKNELSNGNVLWPLRVSLSGKERSASPFEFAWALGKEETQVRIKKAISLL